MFILRRRGLASKVSIINTELWRLRRFYLFFKPASAPCQRSASFDSFTLTMTSFLSSSKTFHFQRDRSFRSPRDTNSLNTVHTIVPDIILCIYSLSYCYGDDSECNHMTYCVPHNAVWLNGNRWFIRLDLFDLTLYLCACKEWHCIKHDGRGEANTG